MRGSRRCTLTARKGAHIHLHHPQVLQRMVRPRHKLRLPSGRAARRSRRRRLPRGVGRQTVQAAQGGHLAAVRQLHGRQRQGGGLGGGAGREVAQRGAARVQQQLVCGRRRAATGAMVSAWRQAAAVCRNSKQGMRSVAAGVGVAGMRRCAARARGVLASHAMTVLTGLDATARLPGHVALQAPAVAQPLQAVQALHCGAGRKGGAPAALICLHQGCGKGSGGL